jgi:lysophospholipase L1-like esterase
MKRFTLSLVLVIFATISGVVMSLNPAAATALENNRYVALGDSVAAGAGLPLASTPEDQLCGRSVEAYPYQVAAMTEMYVEHFACGGAKVDEGLYGVQDVRGTSIAPQLDRAFATGAPDLMSVTIGANDARWSEFVTKCFQWDCGSRWDDVAVGALLLDLRWELYKTMEQIEALSAGDPPQVVFTGYFSPFAATSTTCDEMRNFSAEEVAWMNAAASKLNKVIRNATAWYDFATYIPIDFTGHELCSNDPWIQDIQDPAPMHPTANGQSAIARAVLAAIEE